MNTARDILFQTPDFRVWQNADGTDTNCCEYALRAMEDYCSAEVERRILEMLPSKPEAQRKMFQITLMPPIDNIRGVVSPAMMLNAFDEWFRNRIKGKQ